MHIYYGWVIYMILTSSYIIEDKKGMLLSNAEGAMKIYNYSINRFINCFKNKKHISYYELNNELYGGDLYNHMCYVQSAQQSVREADIVWKNWLKSLEKFHENPSSFLKKPSMPKPIDGKTRRFFITNQTFSIKGSYLYIKKLSIKIKLRKGIDFKNIKNINIKHVCEKKFKLNVVYDDTICNEIKNDNGIYVGVDPGVDNVLTCATNANFNPIMINGKGLKSVNQFFNKKKNEILDVYTKCNNYKIVNNKIVYNYGKSFLKLKKWRDGKLDYFAHKASKIVVEYANECGANTIVIGRNKYQKTKNNLRFNAKQNYLYIPHYKIFKMIKYKAEKIGINVIFTEESYTSQTSFLDNEFPCIYNGNKYRKILNKSPYNRRIKRGIFKSDNGRLINSDVNGALQIIKKKFPDVKFNYGIVGLVLNPVKYNIDF